MTVILKSKFFIILLIRHLSERDFLCAAPILAIWKVLHLYFDRRVGEFQELVLA